MKSINILVFRFGHRLQHGGGRRRLWFCFIIFVLTWTLVLLPRAERSDDDDASKFVFIKLFFGFGFNFSLFCRTKDWKFVALFCVVFQAKHLELKPCNLKTKDWTVETDFDLGTFLRRSSTFNLILFLTNFCKSWMDGENLKRKMLFKTFGHG